jgi:superfamily I DNA/RNA helicase
MDYEDKYKKAQTDRQKYVDAVLNSQSNKKIVVAGPGTGKTFLFSEILKNKDKALTLSFVNTLIEDLSLELCGLSEVKTLHGFACKALGTIIKDVRVFPKLSKVIQEDAKILLNKEIDFDYLFHNRDDENKNIGFYKKRKDYYGNYYGYSDIIFAIVKYFESQKDKIPDYQQILVDEFQDFNKLEVSLIDLLTEKSPILLAGDDDQALYVFKSADPEYIRQRHSDKNIDYASFSLPFCSRCTKVIVEATNDIINKAMEIGLLQNRIKKDYYYFENEEKDKISDKNSKLIHKQLFAKQIPWFIEQQMQKIAEEERAKFSVLIISPTKVQSSTIANSLKNKGFRNTEFVNKKDYEEAILLDGLKILLDNSKSNLGWRIVSKFILKSDDFKKLLKETTNGNSKKVYEIVNKEHKKEIDEMLKTLRTIRNNEKIDKNKLDNILKKIEVDPYEIAKNFLKDEIILDSQRICNLGLRKIFIKSTTIQSSKGLSADYVFITHFNDKYFIRSKKEQEISDQDVCNFLVALTRTKKKVFLISLIGEEKSTFLNWINSDRIEKLL